MAKWLKTDVTDRYDPRLKPAAAELGIKPVYLFGHLQTLKLAVLEGQEDGDLSSKSNEVVASMAEWNPKDADRFVDVLTKYEWLANRLVCGWIDQVGTYLKSKGRRKPDEVAAIFEKHGTMPKIECTKNVPEQYQSSTSTVHVHSSYSTSLDKDKDKETTHTQSACEDFETLVSRTGEYVREKYRDATGSSATDANTREGIKALAREIDAGNLRREDVAHVIKAGLGDAKLPNQGLRGVARNFSKYLPRGSPAEEGKVVVRLVCDLCGHEMSAKYNRERVPADIQIPCRSGRSCGGTMRNPHERREE